MLTTLLLLVRRLQPYLISMPLLPVPPTWPCCRPPQSEREEFAFQRYLHVTRVYSDPQDGDQEGEEDDEEEDGGKAKGGAGPSAPKVAKVR